MSDKIKEILDKLRSDDYYEKEYQKSVYYERDLKKLEDYITNLQQENERLIKELENVSLDEANIRADILLEQEDYKSKIDKAIDILEKDKRSSSFNTAEYLVLNILKGGVDNE